MDDPIHSLLDASLARARGISDQLSSFRAASAADPSQEDHAIIRPAARVSFRASSLPSFSSAAGHSSADRGPDVLGRHSPRERVSDGAFTHDHLAARFTQLTPVAEVACSSALQLPPLKLPCGVHPSCLVETTAAAHRAYVDESMTGRRISHYLAPPPPHYSPLSWIIPCAVSDTSAPRLIHVSDHFRAFILVKSASLLSGNLTLFKLRDILLSWFDNCFAIEQWSGNGTPWSAVLAALDRFGTVCLLVMPGRGMHRSTEILDHVLPQTVISIHNRASAYCLPLAGFRKRLEASAAARLSARGQGKSSSHYAVLARMVLAFAPSYIVVTRDRDGDLRFKYRFVERVEFSPGEDAASDSFGFDLFHHVIASWASGASLGDPDIVPVHFKIATNGHGLRMTDYQHFSCSAYGSPPDGVPSAHDRFAKRDVERLYESLLSADD